MLNRNFDCDRFTEQYFIVIEINSSVKEILNSYLTGNLF